MGGTPATVRCKDNGGKVLIVEGRNDCYGVYELSCKYGLQNSFGLWEAGSDEKALSRFGGLLLSSSDPKQAIGLILDCDAEENGFIRRPERRWQQFSAKLQSLPYEIPDHPDPSGTILNATGDYPRVGVWLMPDNETEGMFEDFLLTIAPNDAIAYAQTVVDEARSRGVTSFKEVHRSKAAAHTYLAWQNEPGLPIGLAIKTQMFNTNAPISTTFRNWLNRLFNE